MPDLIPTHTLLPVFFTQLVQPPHNKRKGDYESYNYYSHKEYIITFILQ